MIWGNGEWELEVCILNFPRRFTKSQLDKMDVDEKVFTWFTAHDWDEDSHLDGLELIKALRFVRDPETISLYFKLCAVTTITTTTRGRRTSRRMTTGTTQPNTRSQQRDRDSGGLRRSWIRSLMKMIATKMV